MDCTAKIIGYRDGLLVVQPDTDLAREIARKGIQNVELYLPDGRRLSPEQRKKICAICNDVARFQGDVPIYVRALLTAMFCVDRDVDVFTLSRRSKGEILPCDMTTAREFIDWLIEFCFYHRIPTNDSLLCLCDDIGQYLYRCLEFRKCAICNGPAETHHIDRIGMGRDREKVVHVGLLAMALCREHHDEAHNRENALFAEKHIYGIKLDEYLCDRLRLNTKERRG